MLNCMKLYNSIKHSHSAAPTSASLKHANAKNWSNHISSHKKMKKKIIFGPTPSQGCSHSAFTA